MFDKESFDSQAPPSQKKKTLVKLVTKVLLASDLAVLVQTNKAAF